MNRFVQLLITYLVCFSGFALAESTPSIDSTFSNIILEGTEKQQRKLKFWLQRISLHPHGYKTLEAIAKSDHQLTIAHSDAARMSAGRTIAPMTMDLSNGVGASVKIIFDANMPHSGTHWVFGMRNELVEFSAVVNLYHELAHAMHQMQGTWRYFASERQAIEEENIFRLEMARSQGEVPILRGRTRGVPREEVLAVLP